MGWSRRTDLHSWSHHQGDRRCARNPSNSDVESLTGSLLLPHDGGRNGSLHRLPFYNIYPSWCLLTCGVLSCAPIPLDAMLFDPQGGGYKAGRIIKGNSRCTRNPSSSDVESLTGSLLMCHDGGPNGSLRRLSFYPSGSLLNSRNSWSTA